MPLPPGNSPQSPSPSKTFSKSFGCEYSFSLFSSDSNFAAQAKPFVVLLQPEHFQSAEGFLGSVEEMRQEDPGQDLQSRLENPVPSSVPSKHLGHWQSTSASARSLRRNRLLLAL